jgi:hypothetical protein
VPLLLFYLPLSTLEIIVFVTYLIIAFSAAFLFFSFLRSKRTCIRLSLYEYNYSDEYQRLVRGLLEQGALPRGGEEALAHPILPQDILREAVPGNIRRAEHFVAFLRRLVDYLKQRCNVRGSCWKTLKVFSFFVAFF